MFEIISIQIFKMLLLLLLGVFCFRTGLIDQRGSKTLANLLLMVISPVLAVLCLQTDYSAALVRGLLLSYGLAILTHIGMMILSTILIRKTGNPDYSIDRFSAMYSNCGFMGIPLVQSVLGNEGVLYLTAYMIVFNVFVWTHGVAVMTEKTSFRNITKALLSPVIIGNVIGMLLFFLEIRLPDVVADTCQYIADMNTPIAMIIAGVSVAQANIPGMLKKKKLYLISAFKLLLMPAIVLMVLILLPLPSTVAYTIMIAASCPAAATCTAFALRFQKNDTYASELYAFTTLCSILTVPVFIFAAERLIL